MVDLGTLRAFIEADDSDFNAAIDRSEQKLDRFTSNVSTKLSRAGESVAAFGKTFTLAVTVPITAAGAALLKTASDAEETANKFGVVFSQVSGQAEAAAQDLSQSFGLASVESQRLLSDTADLLSGFGFSQKAALDLSVQTQKLAGDLASFTNIEGGTARASEALTKALLGEREMAKALGIAILEADVQAQVLKNTQNGLTFETERQAKAFATLQLATSQSKNAIGDFERSSQSLANQTRITLATFKDVALEFGKNLIPVGQQIVRWARDLAIQFQGLAPDTQKLIIIVAGLAAALGPIALVGGKLLTMFGGILSHAPAILAAFNGLIVPIGLLAGGVVLLWQAFGGAEGVRAFMTDFFNFMSENTASTVKFIAEAWLGLQFVWDAVLVGVKTLAQGVLVALSAILTPIRDVSNALGLSIGEGVGKAITAIDGFALALEGSKTANFEAMQSILDNWDNAPALLAEDIEGLKLMFASIPDAMLNGFDNLFPAIAEQLNTFKGEMSTATTEITQTTDAAALGIGASFGAAFGQIVNGADAFKNALVNSVKQLGSKIIQQIFDQVLVIVGLRQTQTAANSAAAAPNPFLIPLFVGIGLAAFAAATGGFGGGGSSGGGGGGVAASAAQSTTGATVTQADDNESFASRVDTTNTVEINDEQGANLMAFVVRKTREGRGDGVGTLALSEDA